MTIQLQFIIDSDTFYVFLSVWKMLNNLHKRVKRTRADLMEAWVEWIEAFVGNTKDLETNWRTIYMRLIAGTDPF